MSSLKSSVDDDEPRTADNQMKSGIKPIVSDFSRNIPLSDEAIRYTVNPQQCSVSAVKANTVSNAVSEMQCKCSIWRTQAGATFHLSQIVQVRQGYQTMRVCTKCY